MPNQSLTDLPERTTTSGSDRIHVNNAGTDYQQTKDDFLQGSLYVAFSNGSTITSQVDALAEGSYFGKLPSANQTTTGTPASTSYYVEVQVASANYASIRLTTYGSNGLSYYKHKVSGTWASSWTQVPDRDEITSLNNSLANKLTNGILLNPVQGASVNTQGMYCSSKGTLSTAETLTFSTSANRFTALVFITGNDARLAIYYIGYKANAVNEATRIAGSTYSVTCSTSGTISVPVSMWTTVIVMGTAEMT